MSILMVTGIEGARNCAAVVGTQLGMEVEVAEGRRSRAGRAAPRRVSGRGGRRTLAECDPAAADAICETRRPGHSPADQLCSLGRGSADPRDSLRAAPPRARAGAGPPRRRGSHRDRAEVHRGRAAAALATGALTGGEVPAAVADRLRVVADLAGSLRQQLSVPAESRVRRTPEPRRPEEASDDPFACGHSGRAMLSSH